MNRTYNTTGTPKIPVSAFKEKYAYQRQGHMLGKAVLQ